MAEAPTSVWVLADQLSHETNTALRRAPRDASVVMIESMRLARRRPFSRVRLALVWSAMRHFAKELRRQGRVVEYHAAAPEKSEDDERTLVDHLRDHVARHGTERILVTTPAEWSMRDYVRRTARQLGVAVETTPNEGFLLGRAEAPTRAPRSPEILARELRRRYQVLVDARGEPEGGQWHFDAKSRRAEEATRTQWEPEPTPPDEITEEVITVVRSRFTDRVGELESFGWPVCHADAAACLEQFVEARLPHWAAHQDSMAAGRSVIAHARLSAALNLGLLDPLTVVARVETAYRAGAVPLDAAAGFIRGVMGWRESVHAVHHAEMPGHLEMNFFEAKRPLPAFFWTGETRCACLADSLRRSLDTGHTNHSERLMVLGNYLLLTGVDPREACEWFASVFADAWEWAVLPNVLGLSLYADGGLVAPKPYAASANFINKTSDHCSRCTYDPAQREGPDACPFNALYWNFIDRHHRRLRGVSRMERALDYLEKKGPQERAQAARDTERHLKEVGLE